MSNPHELFKRINTYTDIQRLIGAQESLFLDFKLSATTDGKPTNDDKHNFKKAISGFAHQEGGVVVWGIDCRKNPDTGIDEAIKEVPIPDIGEFATRLNDFFPNTTEPLVDGYEQKLVFVNDKKDIKQGFLISLIPKSYKVHRILSSSKYQFYKRYGSSFRGIETTEEIRSLFFRQIAPSLELSAQFKAHTKENIHFEVSIKNIGGVLAKHICVELEILPSWFGEIYDGSRNKDWKTWTHHRHTHSRHGFILNGNTVLHPTQEMIIFNGIANSHTIMAYPKSPETVSYQLYAENMELQKGTLEILQK